jgi:hypothetical protein
MLTRLAEERSARRRPMFWMLWASAAVAAAIISIVFFARPVPKPAHVATAKTVAPVQPAPAVPRYDAPTRVIATHRSAPKQQRQKAMAIAGNVRQEVFPAPGPLSEQEQLALQYLRRTPQSELVAMSRPEPEPPQEINQAVPGPEVNRTLQNTNSGSTR